MMQKCSYYKTIENNKIECALCPYNCIINPGKVGNCKVRINLDGELYSLTYGKVASVSNDPIEKKPLYHFYPGSNILSLGTFGCNLHCTFCQNYEISQPESIDMMERYLKIISTDTIIKQAKTLNSIGVAFTYNEPLIWFEYLLDSGKKFHDAGLKNVIVSNGVINPEPLEELIPVIDAANIDLKGISDNFYKDNCGNISVDTVKHTIETLHKNNVPVEVTNLVVTGLNDNLNDIKHLIEYIAEINKNIPLHFSKYYPHYKYNSESTDLNLLDTIYKLAKTQLNYVYIGNIMDFEKCSTYCPECRECLVSRKGYGIDSKITEPKCPKCNSKIEIVL